MLKNKAKIKKGLLFLNIVPLSIFAFVACQNQSSIDAKNPDEPIINPETNPPSKDDTKNQTPASEPENPKQEEPIVDNPKQPQQDASAPKQPENPKPQQPPISNPPNSKPAQPQPAPNPSIPSKNNNSVPVTPNISIKGNGGINIAEESDSSVEIIDKYISEAERGVVYSNPERKVIYQPVEPQPVDPVVPKTPTIKSAGKYKLNESELVKFVQNNSHGYSPEAVAAALKEAQNKTSDIDLLNKIITTNDSSKITWSDLTKLELNPDDEKGILKGDLTVGGHQLSFFLNSDDGLLRPRDYYDQIKKLTFSIDVGYESIALAATQSNPEKFQSAWTNPKGTQLTSVKGREYRARSIQSGTGWVMDRIVKPDDATSDTLTYIVGTNIHVATLADGFLANNNVIQTPLDPLSIQFNWKRAYYSNWNSGFKGTRARPNEVNEIPNLRFGKLDTLNGERASYADHYIINDQNSKLNTFFQPNDEQKVQKQKILDSLLFVPQNTSTYKQPYANSKKLTYNFIGADFAVMKMEFKKSDLEARWPELLDAFKNKTEDKLFLKINTTKPYDQKSKVYTGGYPSYTANPNYWEQQIQINENYSPKKNGKGQFWKAATLSEFQNKNHTKNVEYENGIETNIAVFEIESKLPQINDVFYYIDKYDETEFQKTWGKVVNIEETETDNDLSDEKIKKTIGSRLAEASKEVDSKVLLKKIFLITKRHLMTSTEYYQGGVSGAMVINPKKEIVGIFAAVASDLIGSGHKNALFYDFYNTSSNMVGDKIYGNDITKKLKTKSINTIIMNPKKS